MIAQILKTTALAPSENFPVCVAASKCASRYTYSSYEPVMLAPSTLHTLNVPFAITPKVAYPVPNITKSSTTATAPWKYESRSQVLSIEPVCLSREMRLPFCPCVTGPEGVYDPDLPVRITSLTIDGGIADESLTGTGVSHSIFPLVRFKAPNAPFEIEVPF